MLRRYIEIYSIMLRNSLIREMSFKANFLLWMLVEVLWFVGQIGRASCRERVSYHV